MSGAGPCIVVGFDGSAGSEAAVDYALRRAGPGGRTVIVHAFPVPSDRLGLSRYARALDEKRRRGQAVLDALVMEDAALLDAEVDTELVSGSPADAIIRVAEARSADEIVVGTRGLGAARALLGSVSHDLVHRAHRPLVIISEEERRP